ncbi:MAG: Nif11 family protein [Eggerthellaceae bacterium]|nr:Nif11 family protein [Eggerthellaceae bacterium]
MDLENLNIGPELLEKAKACKSPEEVLALAKREGYKLSDEEMEAVAGGGWSIEDAVPECPRCGSREVSMSSIFGNPGAQRCVCSKCGHSWTNTPFC